MFKRITYASLNNKKSIDNNTSVQQYWQAVDDFIVLKVLGPRPEITKASTSTSYDAIITCVMTVTPSIPTGPSKGNKPITHKSISVPTQPPTARMEARINQLLVEQEAPLAKLAKINEQQTTTSQFL